MAHSSHSVSSPTETLVRHIREIAAPETVSITLDEDRINYILLYFGSFNPPHIGHLEFLKDSGRHMGADLSLAGAFVIPRSDSFLRDFKFRNTSHPLILPHELRARLLYTDERCPSWVATLKERDQPGVELANLQKRARDLGIRIRYMRLIGTPEKLSLTWRGLDGEDFADMILVNTYGRQGGDALASWNLGEQRWQTLHDPDDQIQRYQTALHTKNAAFRGYVRVIRAREAYTSNISSTEIRTSACRYDERALKNCEDMLHTTLSGITLQSHPIWKQWHETARKNLALST